MIRAVFFDVGETLVDETRAWGAWADWLGVPRLTLFAVLGAVIERGEHHRRALEVVRPGIDIEHERAARRAAGLPDAFESADLYPDALPCLRALRAAGYRTGVAASISSTDVLSRLDLPVDIVASSAEWGVEKPALAFFERIADVAQLPPAEIAYVGDRLDNDILPAMAAGMTAVFIRRGPWGRLHALRPEVARAHLRIDSLTELPDALQRRQSG
ncbi:MAG TPA: HAD family hydrolase [Phycisphaerae bacterium]